MKKYLVAVILALSCGLFALPIAENYTIVVPDNANKIEGRAANQFAAYIGKATGFVPVIVTEKDFDKKNRAIYIGQTAFAASQKINFAKLEREEWIIRTVNDNLIITGGYPRGTLYGVYEYLEKQADIHVLDEKTTVIPRNPKLEIGSWNIRFKPVINQRCIHICNTDDHPQLKEFNKGFSAFQTYNGMTKFLGGVRPHHTFNSYARKWPAKPELFSLNSKGERMLPKKGRIRGQICMTNPEARQLTLKQLREFIRQDRAKAAKGNYPPPYVYDISQEDNSHKCECPSCKALAEKEGSYSAPLIDFINFIAREIAKEQPDIFIRTFAYMYSEKPPKTLVADKNVIIQLAMLGSEFGDSSHFYDTVRPITHQLNRIPRQILLDWGKHAHNIARWDYWMIYPRQVAPTVRVNAVIEDLQFYKGNNVKWLFAEMENPVWTSFYSLTRYLGYKFSQKPDADAKATIDQYMNAYYGPAANTMQEYLEHLENTIANYDKNLCARVPDELECFSDEFYIKALALLEKAIKESADSKQYTDRIKLEYPPVYGGILYRWKYLPKMREIFEINDLIMKFKEISMLAIEYRIGNTNPSLRKSCLDSLRKYEKEIRIKSLYAPLPDQFAKMKGKWVDINAYNLAKFEGEWTDFNDYQVTTKANSQVKLVDDKDASLCKAVLYTAPDINTVVINLSDWMTGRRLIRLKVVDLIPDDGKYHWIDLGTFKNKSHGSIHLELPNRNAIYAGFWRLLEYGRDCTYYISLKREDNKLYADRMLVHEK